MIAWLLMACRPQEGVWLAVHSLRGRPGAILLDNGVKNEMVVHKSSLELKAPEVRVDTVGIELATERRRIKSQMACDDVNRFGVSKWMCFTTRPV
jgi:hypothetical protein